MYLLQFDLKLINILKKQMKEIVCNQQSLGKCRIFDNKNV